MVEYSKNSDGKGSVNLGEYGHNTSRKTWEGRTWGSKARYVGYSALYHSAVATIWVIKTSWKGAEIAAPYIAKGLAWTAKTGLKGIKIAVPHVRKGLAWTAKTGLEGIKIAVPHVGKALAWTAKTGLEGIKIAVPHVRKGLAWTAKTSFNGAKSAAMTVYQGIEWSAQSSWSGLQKAGQAVSHHVKDLGFQLQTLPQRIKGQFTSGYQPLHEESSEILPIQETKNQPIPAVSTHHFGQTEVAKAIQEAIAASPNQGGTSCRDNLPSSVSTLISCGVVALQGEDNKNPMTPAVA